MSSFDVTQLRVSGAVLSRPFRYLMLNVNLVRDSTQQCQVASKLGVVMIYVTWVVSVMATNGFQSKYS